MEKRRSEHGVPRVSSPVMTEQHPLRDRALVPMTTQSVRWRGERWRDGGKSDGGRDRWKRRDEDCLLTELLPCRSSAKVCLTWLQHRSLLLSSSSSSSPSPVLLCPIDRVVSSSLFLLSSSSLPSSFSSPPPSFLLPFWCVLVTPRCVRAAAAPCSASRRGSQRERQSSLCIYHVETDTFAIKE